MTPEEQKAADAEQAKLRHEQDEKDKAAAADRAKATEHDAQLTADRKDPVRTVNPRAPEAVARQHQEVDAFNEKRNEENRPGHEKNMERAEIEANEAQARTAHADDHRANHVPTGKQQNRNTPRVLEDGTKVWDQ